MKKTYLIYIVWLILVVIWNFAFPNVTPLKDVIAACYFISYGYYTK